MTWFKVDDKLAFHAKAVAAGNAAMGLWVRAGAWSSSTLTDGFIPDHMARSLGSRSEAKRLVDAGFWETADGGYVFHDWADQNPTRAQVEEQRAAAVERQRRAREKSARARGLTTNDASESHVTNGVSSGTPDPTRPEGEGRTGLPDRDPHPLRTAPEREPNSPATSRPSARRSA